jgi:hypothetical protein
MSDERPRKRFWLWTQILVIAPVLIYVTVEAMRFTYHMWFNLDSARG